MYYVYINGASFETEKFQKKKKGCMRISVAAGVFETKSFEKLPEKSFVAAGVFETKVSKICLRKVL